MIDWYKKVMFENYANFSGRARRSEYWYYILMNVIIFIFSIILCACLDSISESLAEVGIGILLLYFLAIVIPSLAVLVRRLHDIDKSGWYYFIRFIPIIGPIWLLIMLCTNGIQGRNNYGDDPKQIYDETDDIGIDSLNVD
ncbi:MAG: DUF805 domain-containing protein [Flavobacterium sp.]